MSCSCRVRLAEAGRPHGPADAVDSSMSAPGEHARLAVRAGRRGVLAAFALAVVSLAHVGSPDTFFSGKAGPYDVRVSVRLPGVIPGRAQVTVRVAGAVAASDYRVAIRAGQWNVGLKGAPPPDIATPVPGDPTLFATEIWFMTPSSYQVAVNVDGPMGHGTALVPVMALATADRTMPPWLGGVLAALGVLLTAGLLTIIGAALRESVLAPGVAPDHRRRRRARIGMAGTAVVAGLAVWGGNVWWEFEANAYRELVRYRPFASTATVSAQGDREMLTLSIRDDRWTGTPVPGSRYNALLPDHGKLMHLFLVREEGLDAFAHLHPVARSPEALDFDSALPRLPAGRYRVYGDIVHESGYAQTLVATAAVERPGSDRVSDPDDSWTSGAPAGAQGTAYPLPDGAAVAWNRGDAPFVAGEERVLSFSVRDASGSLAMVEPYMGMAAHAIVASHDHAVFAHLHPAGSISMAAWQRFTSGAGPGHVMPAAPHAGHTPELVGSAVEVPYAFPSPGRYRIWVQVKRAGLVHTAVFDADVR
ncbi:MAG: hypothetical protein ACT4QD_25145 [Acidobacteriota bacterium]